MPPTIDWLYFRRGCETCKKAKAYLDKHKITVKELCDTEKNPHDQQAALKLAQSASRILATRGPKVYDLGPKDRPTPEQLKSLVVGPTGKLRAPTFFKGKTMVVGFTPAVYDEVLR